jgi:hypothetical protein
MRPTGVHILRTPADIAAETCARDADDVLVEEFIPRSVCHVDGSCVVGEVLFACTSRYVNDCLAFHDSVFRSAVRNWTQEIRSPPS